MHQKCRRHFVWILYSSTCHYESAILIILRFFVISLHLFLMTHNDLHGLWANGTEKPLRPGNDQFVWNSLICNRVGDRNQFEPQSENSFFLLFLYFVFLFELSDFQSLHYIISFNIPMIQSTLISV